MELTLGLTLLCKFSAWSRGWGPARVQLGRGRSGFLYTWLRVLPFGKSCTSTPKYTHTAVETPRGTTVCGRHSGIIQALPDCLWRFDQEVCQPIGTGGRLSLRLGILVPSYGPWIFSPSWSWGTVGDWKVSLSLRPIWVTMGKPVLLWTSWEQSDPVYRATWCMTH